MKQYERMATSLDKYGYGCIDEKNITPKVIEEIIGVSIKSIEKDFLKPKKVNKNNSGAWSNIYSDKEFPPHTDFAYQSVPPKFIGLHCTSNQNSERSTSILDSQIIPYETICRLSKVLWRIRHSERVGTIRLFDKKSYKGKSILRFDPVCMTPYFKKDRWAVELLGEVFKEYSFTVSWEVNRFVIIDNWRCFHGRGLNIKTSEFAENRVLERHSIYI